MFDDTLFCCISKWNWSDEYSVRGRIQKCGEGGNGAWVFGAVGAGVRERKDTWSWGLREGVGAWGPNLEDGVRARAQDWEEGVGARDPNSEDGVRAGGPHSEDGVGAGAREKRDAVRNMSMKRRRDKRGHDTRWFVLCTCKDWESEGEMDWRRRDGEVQVIPNLCEMNRPGCGTTTTDCHRHGLHHRTAACNTSATSSTSRRVVKTVMTRTVYIGVHVCDEWSLARFVEYYLLSSTWVYINGMQ